MGRSHRSTSSLKLSESPPIDLATGGFCSLLFQHNPRNGRLQATSGFGLEALRTDPWLPGAEEAAIVADSFARRAPTLVQEMGRQAPDLAARLGTRSALLLPLVR